MSSPIQVLLKLEYNLEEDQTIPDGQIDGLRLINIPVLCTFDIHKLSVSTNIQVLCTSDIHDKHISTNIPVRCIVHISDRHFLQILWEAAPTAYYTIIFLQKKWRSTMFNLMNSDRVTKYL